MFRIIWSVFFISVMSYAVWLYMHREQKTLKETMMAKKDEEARVEFENFIIYRYKLNKLVSKVSARTGQFIEPNSIELFGNFQSYRYKKGWVESIKSEIAVGYFDADNLSEMFQGPDLLKANVYNKVKIQSPRFKLLTESAEYIAKEDVIIGDKPVQVVANKSWFRGKNGFRYDLSGEIFNLYGRVNGEAKFVQ